MKTCEEYVIKRVEELEKRNEALVKENELLKNKLDVAESNYKEAVKATIPLKVKVDDVYYKIYVDENFGTLVRINKVENTNLNELINFIKKAHQILGMKMAETENEEDV